jgi:hypothetical protein
VATSVYRAEEVISPDYEGFLTSFLRYFQRVLESCDDALRSAAYMGDEVTNEANESFEFAVQSLAKYELRFQSG